MSVGRTGRTRVLGASAQVSQWLNRSFIKSIQSGTIAINAAASATATITGVALPNSVLYYGGFTTDDGGTTRPVGTARLSLTNATTVTATNGLASGIQTVAYQVIEYWPKVIKTIQRFSGGAGTYNITAVNLSKTYLVVTGFTLAVYGTNDQEFASVVITNATTVTVATITGGNGPIVEFQVAKFY